jgi:hypothetical protein
MVARGYNLCAASIIARACVVAVGGLARGEGTRVFALGRGRDHLGWLGWREKINASVPDTNTMARVCNVQALTAFGRGFLGLTKEFYPNTSR